MGPEEAWIIELTLYCIVMIVPVLSLISAVYGFQQIVVRRRMYFKLVGLFFLLFGILGGIATLLYILPFAADSISTVHHAVRITPVPIPYTGN